MERIARVQRTKTDEDRVEHLADADGRGEDVVNLDAGEQPWLAGTISSAVQVQVLRDHVSPREALDRGGPSGGEGETD